MATTQITIQHKSDKSVNISLITAVTIIHLLLIGLIIFPVNPSHSKTTVKIAFLGSILDPSETKRTTIQNHLSTNNSIVIPLENQKNSVSSATSLTKPQFSQKLNSHRKTVFKSPPQSEASRKEILPNKTRTTHEYHSTQQPYQHLKLYP